MQESAPVVTNAQRRAVLVARFEEKLRDIWPDGGGKGAKSGGGWHECKVGVVASCIKGHTDEDGEYHDPETLTQTNLATMEDIDRFGDMLTAEAKRRGMDHAGEVVAVSDAGHPKAGRCAAGFAKCGRVCSRGSSGYSISSTWSGGSRSARRRSGSFGGPACPNGRGAR